MKAEFIGKDRSMGFRKGETYILKTDIKKQMIWIVNQESNLYCCYDSVENFLKNWRILSV